MPEFKIRIRQVLSSAPESVGAEELAPAPDPVGAGELSVSACLAAPDPGGAGELSVPACSVAPDPVGAGELAFRLGRISTVVRWGILPGGMLGGLAL